MVHCVHYALLLSSKAEGHKTEVCVVQTVDYLDDGATFRQETFFRTWLKQRATHSHIGISFVNNKSLTCRKKEQKVNEINRILYRQDEMTSNIYGRNTIAIL